MKKLLCLFATLCALAACAPDDGDDERPALTEEADAGLAVKEQAAWVACHNYLLVAPKFDVHKVWNFQTNSVQTISPDPYPAISYGFGRYVLDLQASDGMCYYHGYQNATGFFHNIPTAATCTRHVVYGTDTWFCNHDNQWRACPPSIGMARPEYGSATGQDNGSWTSFEWGMSNLPNWSVGEVPFESSSRWHYINNPSWGAISCSYRTANHSISYDRW